jgi:hypothetical protein
MPNSLKIEEEVVGPKGKHNPTGSPCRDKASVPRSGNATAEMDEVEA